MQMFLWKLTIIFSMLAFCQMGLAFLYEDSSPKQAASGVFALCLAVVPYVLARAVQEHNALEPSATEAKKRKSEGELAEIEEWLEE